MLKPSVFPAFGFVGVRRNGRGDGKCTPPAGSKSSRIESGSGTGARDTPNRFGELSLSLPSGPAPTQPRFLYVILLPTN